MHYNEIIRDTDKKNYRFKICVFVSGDLLNGRFFLIGLSLGGRLDIFLLSLTRAPESVGDVVGNYQVVL